MFTGGIYDSTRFGTEAVRIRSSLQQQVGTVITTFAQSLSCEYLYLKNSCRLPKVSYCSKYWLAFPKGSWKTYTTYGIRCEH